MTITCLLPVRNGEADLDDWLESVRGLADSVIALDDGSTDRTRAMLESDRSLERVLTTPRRDGYAGWNDAENRQRLLDAAVESEAGWVLFLDLDERIDSEDAMALRSFLTSDAVSSCAYGLQLYRAWGEDVEPDPTYVYRLFFAQPGQRLPIQALHFNPVPRSIPASMWIRTTIRARHLESPARLEERRRKYAEADPESRWPAMPLEPPAQLVRWGQRPSDIPVLAVGPEGERAAFSRSDPEPITCLLPVRNGEADLPSWLDSVRAFASHVIALDDGSTDATAEILEASPLVGPLLHNPRRETYAGWNDAANRQRLLEAFVDAGGGWALFLDADERVTADDGAALKAFVQSGADPDHAYGFRVFRMVEDDTHYDRARLWVYRMFYARSGQTLPADALHFVPIPVDISRERWIKTTIRIKHLASITADLRSRRLRKYTEADPERRWQADYSGLVEAGPHPLAWTPRPEGMPILADPLARGAAGELDLAELAPDAPLLSAVIISRNDADTIERTVRSVIAQDCHAPFEVILAASGNDGTADLVRRRFPSVTVVDVPEPGLPGAARNAGVAIARGEIVSFPGSHTELPPGSLQARMRAHEQGYSMVTGSIHNGQSSRSGWAAYFLDHSTALPGRPSAELDAPPAHCSYTREALAQVGGFPEDMRAGEDTVVNQALWQLGHRAYREQQISLSHRNPCSDPVKLARHHFTRGRALGRILLTDRSRREALLALRGYFPRRMASIDANLERWGKELLPVYRRSRSLVRLGVSAAAAGALVESLIGEPVRSELGGASPSAPSRPTRRPLYDRY
jgi:glycosyltransferase involved in cell wall biosynthesis